MQFSPRAKTGKLTHGCHLGGQILVVIVDLLDVCSSQFGVIYHFRPDIVVVVIMRWICRPVCWSNPGITYFQCFNLSDRWAAPSQKYVRGWVQGLAQKNSFTHFAHLSPKFYRGLKSANFGLNFQPRSTSICSSFKANQYGWNLKQTRCSAIAARPRCRVRYSFRQK